MPNKIQYVQENVKTYFLVVCLHPSLSEVCTVPKAHASPPSGEPCSPTAHRWIRLRSPRTGLVERSGWRGWRGNEKSGAENGKSKLRIERSSISTTCQWGFEMVCEKHWKSGGERAYILTLYGERRWIITSKFGWLAGCSWLNDTRVSSQIEQKGDHGWRTPPSDDPTSHVTGRSKSGRKGTVWRTIFLNIT